MLVLSIMLVPTVKADTYTTKDDIVIDTKYYEFFKAKFGEDTGYKFFAYDCTRSNYSYTATCYYGIDKNNNYIFLKVSIFMNIKIINKILVE